LCRPEGFEPQRWPRHALNRSVVVFKNIIEIFDLTDFDVRLMFCVVAFDRRLVCAALVDRDLLGYAMMTDRLA
jgi:hypothetical protein